MIHGAYAHRAASACIDAVDQIGVSNELNPQAAAKLAKARKACLEVMGNLVACELLIEQSEKE